MDLLGFSVAFDTCPFGHLGFVKNCFIFVDIDVIEIRISFFFFLVGLRING